MRLSHAGTSDVGRKRTHNEDAYLLLPEENLFCVADGMGGHASGEVAARIAVEEMAEFFRMTGRDEEATWPYKMDPARGYDENRLLTGVKLANLRIFERSATDQRLRGMGTTIVAVSFPREGDAVLVAHVGDSRVYLLRGGTLRQLTEDHSLLNDYKKSRALTPEEIEAFPHKNVIVRALGMKDTVEVDLVREELQDGDVLLLCSDGLSGMVPDERIAEIVRGHPRDLEGRGAGARGRGERGGRDGQHHLRAGAGAPVDEALASTQRTRSWSWSSALVLGLALVGVVQDRGPSPSPGPRPSRSPHPALTRSVSRRDRVLHPLAGRERRPVPEHRVLDARARRDHAAGARRRRAPTSRAPGSIRASRRRAHARRERDRARERIGAREARERHAPGEHVAARLEVARGRAEVVPVPGDDAPAHRAARHERRVDVPVHVTLERRRRDPVEERRREDVHAGEVPGREPLAARPEAPGDPPDRAARRPPPPRRSARPGGIGRRTIVASAPGRAVGGERRGEVHVEEDVAVQEHDRLRALEVRPRLAQRAAGAGDDRLARDGELEPERPAASARRARHRLREVVDVHDGAAHPGARRSASDQRTSGTPQTGTAGFGTRSVSGRSRVPSPAQSTIPTISPTARGSAPARARPW